MGIVVLKTKVKDTENIFNTSHGKISTPEGDNYQNKCKKHIEYSVNMTRKETDHNT